MKTTTHCDEDGQFLYNPDLTEVAALMNQTWPLPRWKYTPELLTAYIGRPTGDLQLSVGYCIEGQLAGYYACIPYRASINNKEISVIYGTFWTVHQKYQGRKIAKKLVEHLLELAISKGFSGRFGITHFNSVGDKARRSITGGIGQPTSTIKVFKQLMGLPSRIQRKLSNVSRCEAGLYETTDEDDCYHLLATLSNSADITRIFSPEDVPFVLSMRPNTRTWLFRDGTAVRGLINGIVKHYVTSERETSNLYLEHIVFGDLNEKERDSLMASVLRDPFCQNIDIIYIPAIGYFDHNIFTKMGFLTTIEQFSLHFDPFDEGLKIDSVNSFYLDVF